MHLVLPKLFVILDAALLASPITDCARNLAENGVTLLQYRDKRASAREQLRVSRELVALLSPLDVSLIVNDRADIAALAGSRGVHVGQDDLGVEEAREIVGRESWVGISTHNREQFEQAAQTSADYIAVGPIFPTSSKANPDPVVGLELLRQVRSLTEKPIVAIGGITLECAARVMEAGADSVAVISDIVLASDPGKHARQYLDLLGQ